MGPSVGCHRRGVIPWSPRKIVGGRHGVIGGAMGSSGVPWDHRWGAIVGASFHGPPVKSSGDVMGSSGGCHGVIGGAME